MFRRMFLELHKDELDTEPKNLWHLIELDFCLDKNKEKNEIPNIYLVRNPYKRVVSMFTNKYCGGNGHSQLPKKFFLSKVTFRMFVLKLNELKKENKLNKTDYHISEQSHNYKSNENNYLIKLEEFDEKIIKVYKELNLDELIPKIETFLINKGFINERKINKDEENVYDKEFSVEQKIFPDYKYFYNQELLDLVYEIYKDDFLNFGYEKGEI
tara:strand:- start:23 stop:661 length:639 start_codon:yes stop_codon:yes gene_type:complete